MTSEREIETLMDTAMKSLRELVDVNTIIGSIIECGNGTAVIPVSKVSCGFLAGGGEYGKQKETMPFAGGSGAGISLQPVGFLVIAKEQVRLIPVCGAMPLDKAIEAVPVVAQQLRDLCRGQDS
ncbi:MAG: GerW family sporulation protein [Firmicutes bacterium]|nr:GerW family sporulation protein [Bacillota bacterium]